MIPHRPSSTVFNTFFYNSPSFTTTRPRDAHCDPLVPAILRARRPTISTLLRLLDRPLVRTNSLVMADADADVAVKRETKPSDFSTAILERKKAPNRLVVGACERVAIAMSSRSTSISSRSDACLRLPRAIRSSATTDGGRR